MRLHLNTYYWFIVRPKKNVSQEINKGPQGPTKMLKNVWYNHQNFIVIIKCQSVSQPTPNNVLTHDLFSLVVFSLLNILANNCFPPVNLYTCYGLIERFSVVSLVSLSARNPWGSVLMPQYGLLSSRSCVHSHRVCGMCSTTGSSSQRWTGGRVVPGGRAAPWETIRYPPRKVFRPLR